MECKSNRERTVAESFIGTNMPADSFSYWNTSARGCILLPYCLVDLKLTFIYSSFNTVMDSRVLKVGTFRDIWEAILYKLTSNYWTYTRCHSCILHASSQIVHAFLVISSENYARLSLKYFYERELEVQRPSQMACYSYRFSRRSCNQCL
jgi:hypothetical protein